MIPSIKNVFGRFGPIGLAVLLSVLAVSALACTAGPAQPDGDGTGNEVLVVTTLYPLEYFAGRIGGDRVRVVNLVSPGVEAHDFEPTPEDIRVMDSADVIAYNGLGFEPWIDRALESFDGGDRIVIEAAAGIGYDGVQDGQAPVPDPHVWLNPLLAIGQATAIRDALSSADPDGSEEYASASEDLIGELRALDARMESGLAGCRLDSFVTSHSAFGHLARRYGLADIAVSGISPEAEPTPRDLADIADTIRASSVRHILVEPGVSQRLSRTLADEVGATALPLTPLETLTPEQAERGETYFTIMDANLMSLRQALECPHE